MICICLRNFLNSLTNLIQKQNMSLNSSVSKYVGYGLDSCGSTPRSYFFITISYPVGAVIIFSRTAKRLGRETEHLVSRRSEVRAISWLNIQTQELPFLSQ
jgi:hypothetical protein